MARDATAARRVRRCGAAALSVLTLAMAAPLAANAVGPGLAPGSPLSRVAAPSTGELITFEEAVAHPDGDAPTVLTDQYADRGVRFTTSVMTLVIDGTTNPALAGFAHSDSTVVTSCFVEKSCSGDVRLEFEDPVSAAGAWVGSWTSPPAATVVMTALDALGKPVTTASAELGHDGGAVPVESWLETTDAAGRIHGLQIGWKDPKLGRYPLALDDLAFTPFVRFTEVTAVPASLELDADLSTGEVRFENTGNVEIAVGGAESTAPFTTEDGACAGPLPVGESCVISVGFAPADASPNEVSGTLTLWHRGGDSLATVELLGTVVGPESESPSAPTESSTPTPTSQPTPTPDQTDGPAKLGSDDVATTSGASRWGLGLLTVLVVVALVAAIGAWVRPTTTPREATAGADAPRLHTRVDPGVQRVRSRGPAVGLHGRWDPSDGSTAIHEGRHP